MIRAALLLAFLAGAANAATTFHFTAATGNINDGGPFGNTSPGVAGTDYPTNGDSFDVKAGSTATVPTGYGVKLSSITLIYGTSRNTPTVLYIQSNSSVGVTGSIQMAGSCISSCGAASGFSNIYLLAGSTLALNNSNIIDNASGNSIDGFYFWGNSATNPAFVTGSTGSFVAGPQGGFNQHDTSWTYVSFNGLGNMGASYCNANANFRVSSITWVASGEYQEPTVRSGCVDKYTEYSDFRNQSQVGAGVAILIAGNATTPSNKNDFNWNTISTDTPASQLSMQINAQGVQVSSNVFKNYSITWATSNGLDGDIENNFFGETNAAGGTCTPFGSPKGNFKLINNFGYSECSNTHALNPGNPSTATIVGNVLDVFATNPVINQDGKFYLGNSVASAFSSGTVSANICVGEVQSASLFDWLGAASAFDYTQWNHNTVVYSSYSASQVLSLATIGEAYAGRSNMMTWMMGNLISMSTPTSSCHIMQDLNSGSAANKISSISTSGYWNCGSTLYQTTGNYPTLGSDVTADPNFPNKNASFRSWDSSRGGPGTSTDGFACMLQANGYGGAPDSTCTTILITNYFKTMLTPMSLAFKGKALDGNDIGAQPVNPPNGFFGGSP